MRNARMRLVMKIHEHVKSIAIDVAYNAGRSSIFLDPTCPAETLQLLPIAAVLKE